MSVFDYIQSGFDLYKKTYRLFLPPFGLLLAITLLVAFLSVFISFASPFAKESCDIAVGGLTGFDGMFSTMFTGFICEQLKPSSLANRSLSWASHIFEVLITLAVLGTMADVVYGRKPSDWKGNIGLQLGNAVKLFIVDMLLNLVVFVPIIVTLLMIVSDGSQVFSSGLDVTQSMLRYMGTFILAGLFGFLVYLVIMFLLTFVRVELVLNNKGIGSAINNSASIVRGNLDTVFLFQLAWFMISIAAGVVTFFSCCFAIFVSPVIAYFLLMPVRLFSEILLWKDLTKQDRQGIQGELQKNFSGFEYSSNVIKR